MESNSLSEIGLNQSDVQVYFSLLELNECTVGPLTKKAGVPDSKIYAILEKLIAMGLASVIIKNNIKHFQVAHPDNIYDLLEKKEREIGEKKRELKEVIIPKIEARRKFSGEHQEARVYESFNGIKSAFNLILETVPTGGQYQVFMLGPTLKKRQVINFFQNFHDKRTNKKISVRLLSNIDHRSIVEKEHIYPGMEFRYTPQKLPIGTFIYENHVMTIVWEDEPTAFVIKSKRNYDYYLEFFEDVWSKAKK
ncbi:MAG: helix-turn-helix domain-containing protein [Candidatus Altiarchaeota archaeon]